MFTSKAVVLLAYCYFLLLKGTDEKEGEEKEEKEKKEKKEKKKEEKEENEDDYVDSCHVTDRSFSPETFRKSKQDKLEISNLAAAVTDQVEQSIEPGDAAVVTVLELHQDAGLPAVLLVVVPEQHEMTTWIDTNTDADADADKIQDTRCIFRHQ